MSHRLFAAALLSLGLASALPAQAQNTPPGEAVIRQAEQARDRALAGNIALDYVTQITTRFGPRPAGSPSEQAAAEWAAAYMREHGFRNVRIERFPLVGWDRGQESGAIVGARPQPLAVASLGHAPATPEGGVEGEVVRFTSLEALQAAPDGSLTGKIAFIDMGQMHAMQDGSGYGPQTRVRGLGPAAARDKGAAAFLIRSVGSDENRLPHTGTTRYVDGRPTLPSFAVSAPDADQLSRLIGMGETVRVHLLSTARTYETTSQNVIGDIPGRDRPDEIIVLGSHMDSWDQGTGAIDDAAGGAITLAAARAVAETGRGPSRTVRVILYGAEEVAQPVDTGNGGGAYVRGIGEGVAQHVVAGESDFGADRIYSLGLPPGAQGTPFARAAAQVLYPIGVLASPRPELHGGVDIGPLAEAGVPVFGLYQDGTRYFDLHHTANDTLDKIDPEQLTQNVAAWAGLIWLIANTDVDFRATRPATEAAH